MIPCDQILEINNRNFDLTSDEKGDAMVIMEHAISKLVHTRNTQNQVSHVMQIKGEHLSLPISGCDVGGLARMVIANPDNIRRFSTRPIFLRGQARHIYITLSDSGYEPFLVETPIFDRGILQDLLIDMFVVCRDPRIRDFLPT